MILCFGTHSIGSVVLPKTMRSIVMPACLTGRSTSVWQDDRRDPVWNVPRNTSPVLLMGRYLCCCLWKSLTVKEYPSSRKWLSYFFLGRHVTIYS